MTDRRTEIISHASNLILRYGLRKVTMSDVAKAAEVSRQTLYGHFDNKDALLEAVVAASHEDALQNVRADWAQTTDLDARVEAYFDRTARMIFQVLQKMPDAEDLLDGAQYYRAATEQAHEAEVAALTEMYAESGARADGPTGAAALARLTYAASAKFKLTAKTEAELDTLLETLKLVILHTLRGT